MKVQALCRHVLVQQHSHRKYLQECWIDYGVFLSGCKFYWSNMEHMEARVQRIVLSGTGKLQRRRLKTPCHEDLSRNVRCGKKFDF